MAEARFAPYAAWVQAQWAPQWRRQRHACQPRCGGWSDQLLPHRCAQVRTELNLAVAHILAKYGVSVAPNSIALYSMQNADFYSRNGFIGRGNGAAPKQPAPAEQQFQRYALD